MRLEERGWIEPVETQERRKPYRPAAAFAGADDKQRGTTPAKPAGSVSLPIRPGEEYAKAGIPHYWIVRLDQSGVSIIERYRLDSAAMLYKHVETLMKEADPIPGITNPLPLTIEWTELQF